MSALNTRFHQALKYKRTTILQLFALLLLSAALAATASAQNTVSFFDATFGPGWAGTVAGITGTVNYNFVTSATGGYPGAFERDAHALTSSGGEGFLYLANFNPVNTFTGTFQSVSYSYDLVNPGAFDVLYAVAIEQTVGSVTNIYIPNKSLRFDVVHPASTFAAAANPYFYTGLTASQFCKIPSNAAYGNDIDCTQNPDFNNLSQQTAFGYVVGNSFTGNATVHYQSGIDNWCVVLDGASGPGGVGRGCRGGY